VTVDDRLFLDLKDIVAIQVECPECHATISSTPAEWHPKETICPNCPKTLWPAGGSEIQRLVRVADALREITTGGPKIRLVLNAAAIRKPDK